MPARMIIDQFVIDRRMVAALMYADALPTRSGCNHDAL